MQKGTLVQKVVWLRRTLAVNFKLSLWDVVSESSWKLLYWGIVVLWRRERAHQHQVSHRMLPADPFSQHLSCPHQVDWEQVEAGSSLHPVQLVSGSCWLCSQLFSMPWASRFSQCQIHLSAASWWVDLSSCTLPTMCFIKYMFLYQHYCWSFLSTSFYISKQFYIILIKQSALFDFRDGWEF